MRNHDKSIVETFASNEYVELDISQTSSVNQRLREDERIFNYETYAKEIHPPILVDLGETLELSPLPRCLDMPLRLSGEDEYRLPAEWESLKPTLEKIVAVEHTHNPHWKDYFTYLTIDNKPVQVGQQQRHGGLHVDGFQGERIFPKLKISRNYVATTNGGTQFWPQRFVVADPARFNVFKGFDFQRDGEPLVAEENQVYFMDAYTVHESGFARFNGDRLFLRVSYDLREFDRLGNTHNPNLDYEWKMEVRNAQDLVADPRLTDVMDSPYWP